jgi:hypothetical protein
MKYESKKIVQISLAALLIAGCGQKAITEDAPPVVDAAAGTRPDSTGPLFPLAIGNSWTYRVTDSDGVVSDKVTIVDSESQVGGSGVHKDEVALHVLTTKDDGSDKTESWQAVEGEAVVRYREISYQKASGDLELDEDWDPSKLHVDGSAEATELGASFLMIYSENKTDADGVTTHSEARDRWTVVGVDEQVTVQAGTFRAIHLQKTGSSLKDYWYVRGVGKVREAGSQIEELTNYEIASD